MRKSMPLRVDPVLLHEVRKRAKAEKRTLSECVENVLRRDLAHKQRKGKKPAIELRGPIPADIHNWKSARIPGEPERKRTAREKLVHAILDLGGVPVAKRNFIAALRALGPLAPADRFPAIDDARPEPLDL